jgi:hypothetical protein
VEAFEAVRSVRKRQRAYRRRQRRDAPRFLSSRYSHTLARRSQARRRGRPARRGRAAGPAQALGAAPPTWLASRSPRRCSRAPAAAPRATPPRWSSSPAAWRTPPPWSAARCAKWRTKPWSCARWWAPLIATSSPAQTPSWRCAPRRTAWSPRCGACTASLRRCPHCVMLSLAWSPAAERPRRLLPAAWAAALRGVRGGEPGAAVELPGGWRAGCGG